MKFADDSRQAGSGISLIAEPIRANRRYLFSRLESMSFSRRQAPVVAADTVPKARPKMLNVRAYALASVFAVTSSYMFFKPLLEEQARVEREKAAMETATSAPDPAVVPALDNPKAISAIETLSEKDDQLKSDNTSYLSKIGTIFGFRSS